MKQVLHPVHGKSKWCGPTVLSAITGFSTDDISPILRLTDPRRAPLKGMYNREIIHVVNLAGGSASSIAVDKGKLTLKQWMDARDDLLRTKVVVVVVSNHYVLVKGDLVMCSQSSREWMHINSHPYGRKKVTSAIVVVPPVKAKLPPELKGKKLRDKRLSSAAAQRRRETKARASRLGVGVEKDDDLLVVTMVNEELYAELFARHGLDADTDLSEVFYSEVLGGYSLAHDWAEVDVILDNVEGFIKRETGVRMAA